MSALVPEVNFLIVELFVELVVQESFVDCVGFVDTFKSLVSLISLSEQFCTDFKGKSVLLVALLKELPVSLGCNVSEMLGKSI